MDWTSRTVGIRGLLLAVLTGFARADDPALNIVDNFNTGSAGGVI